VPHDKKFRTHKVLEKISLIKKTISAPMSEKKEEEKMVQLDLERTGPKILKKK
jgi:hypothetical protein